MKPRKMNTNATLLHYNLPQPSCNYQLILPSFPFYFGRPMSLHQPSAPQHTHASSGTRVSAHHVSRPSLLAWPAWLRVLAILPVVALLWTGVAWALTPAAPW
ncbi:MAG: hypothetical protein ACI9LD_000040 [Polaromonas sp.]|jgi:hypothetical protein